MKDFNLSRIYVVLSSIPKYFSQLHKKTDIYRNDFHSAYTGKNKFQKLNSLHRLQMK